MTRSMGDAIHVNVPALATAGTDMVAGYVTGSADILWTASDWALFAGKGQVTIDQGYTGSPVATADVRDVEQGAWSVSAAVNTAGWDALRPTIYCSASVLSSLAAAGWQGDVWVADWTGSPPAEPYPVPAGMTCVGVQYTDQGGGGAYDLSVVFDPTWPEAAMAVPTVTTQQDWSGCTKCGCMFYRPLVATAVCANGGQHTAPDDYFDFALPYIHMINGVAQ